MQICIALVSWVSLICCGNVNSGTVDCGLRTVDHEEPAVQVTYFLPKMK